MTDIITLSVSARSLRAIWVIETAIAAIHRICPRRRPRHPRKQGCMRLWPTVARDWLGPRGLGAIACPPRTSAAA